MLVRGNSSACNVLAVHVCSLSLHDLYGNIDDTRKKSWHLVGDFEAVGVIDPFLPFLQLLVLLDLICREVMAFLSSFHFTASCLLA
jgi:hypothetical protein